MFESFSVIFLSIVLEAMPFIILGTIISSLIEVFLPPDWIERKFKKSRWTNYLLAGLIGFVFPICECAIVPIMRRLVKKGLPLSLGATFMVATPIVNPVVLLSTYYAFGGDMTYVLGRGIIGYIVAVIIGMIVMRYDKKVVLLKNVDETSSCGCGSSHCDQKHDHGHNHDHEHHNHSHHHHDHSDGKRSWGATIAEVIEHTGHEIIDVGKFLIMGALLTSLMQTFIPRNIFIVVSENAVLSILLMMLLAFVLSLCSEADAFIAASFANQFSPAALMAFMVLGPMIDIKNVMLLSGSFKRTFIVRLVAIITSVVFAAMLIVNVLGILG